MEEHVAVRCGEHALLFPAENVGLIEPVPARDRLSPRRGPRRAGEVLIDLRRLLMVTDPAPVERCVLLRWCSTDGARQVTLIVDAVDAIVDCDPAELIGAVILPARLRPLCDRVMRDGRGALRLCVKRDATLPVRGREDRRRLLASCLVRTPSAEASP